MLKGFRACFIQASRCVVPVAIVVSGMSLSSLANAQTEVVPVAEQKKKVEPVFRVSKLATPAVKPEDIAPTNNQPVVTKDPAQPVNRVASTAIRPGGNRVVGSAPASNLDLPANTMEAPASNAVPVAPGKAKSRPREHPILSIAPSNKRR